MENKNNNEWCKHIKNSFGNGSVGNYTIDLGKFENGDQYRLENSKRFYTFAIPKQWLKTS